MRERERRRKRVPHSSPSKKTSLTQLVLCHTHMCGLLTKVHLVLDFICGWVDDHIFAACIDDVLTTVAGDRVLAARPLDVIFSCFANFTMAIYHTPLYPNRKYHPFVFLWTGHFSVLQALKFHKSALTVILSSQRRTHLGTSKIHLLRLTRALNCIPFLSLDALLVPRKEGDPFTLAFRTLFPSRKAQHLNQTSTRNAYSHCIHFLKKRKERARKRQRG